MNSFPNPFITISETVLVFWPGNDFAGQGQDIIPVKAVRGAQFEYWPALEKELLVFVFRHDVHLPTWRWRACALHCFHDCVVPFLAVTLDDDGGRLSGQFTKLFPQFDELAVE